MTSLSVRGIVSACAATAALAVAALPATANAEQCAGSAIRGKGSSAQKLLQKEIWNKDFNTSGNALACNGSQGSTGKPAVSYESTGSGAGLESWGVEQKKPGEQELWFAGQNAFVGTEIAPSAKQESEILTHAAPGAKVLTIPVAQPAIAIVIHLPKGCKVKGGGVLKLKQKTLEAIFQANKITTFGKIGKYEEAVKGACKNAHLTRAVREDGSGTTDAFKKVLNELAKGKPVYESGETWAENGEKTANTTWPGEGADATVKGNGGGGLVSKVVATEGSVGYANVADARANKAFIPASEGGTGGPGTEVFWAEVENSKGHFANPSTNGEIAGKSNSNCENVTYVNGDGKKHFPPPSTTELWNEVTVSTTQTTYFPCYLTFDLALTHYEGADVGTVAGAGETEAAAPTAEEAQTVKDYIKYELSSGTEGAQEAAEGQDYLGLPHNEVLTIAREGAEKIGF